MVDRARWGSVLLTCVCFTGAVLEAAPATAAPAAPPTEPPGTTTIIEDAGWSWFEDERATFSGDGQRLYASAVTGTGSTTLAPGTVALVEMDLGNGNRRLVDLGAAEADDHNSASIWEADGGELTTSWSRHHRDAAIRTQRRRTDGSWLRLPPITTSGQSTYSNLLASAEGDGSEVLYNFFRGQRFDPSVLASPDLGRTWLDLGRVLKDPGDGLSVRPYVQYASDGDGRIHLLATPAHPTSVQTAVYHGYVEDGMVHDSVGTVLGPLGSAVDVTSLTPVWTPTGGERGWTADIAVDPSTGAPVVAFSVRNTPADHRYWWARWDGAAWQSEEVAHSGRALLSSEPDYTGLATIDPADPTHLVISTDVHPVSGAPLLSDTDGRQHWELWDGHRSGFGTWSWTALTANSALDNIRPAMIAGPDGNRGLLWLRGTYRSFTNYDLDLVGVVRPRGGAPRLAGSAELTPATDVLPAIAPRPQTGRPIVGQLDGHRPDDIFLYRPGAAADDLHLGDDQRHATPIAVRQVSGTYTPIPGDYDGDGRTDVYWYVPGPGSDQQWTGSGIGTFTMHTPRQVNGTYTPIPGDYNGDGHTDIYWYAPGTAPDSLWLATPTGTFAIRTPRQVNGTYTPIPGDYNGDGHTDIYWYAPGTAPDSLWLATPTGTFTIRTPRQVNGTYTPIPGDYNGDGHTDIYWYRPGTAPDSLWLATPTGTFTIRTPRQVNGTYTPIPGDYNGDGHTDIHWYAPGAPGDYLWWSDVGILDRSEAAATNL